MTKCKCGFNATSSISHVAPCRRCGAILKITGRDSRLLAVADRFRQDGDTGLGDTFEHIAHRVGVDRVTAWLKRWGFDCKCSNRKRWMNARWPYPTTDERGGD